MASNLAKSPELRNSDLLDAAALQHGPWISRSHLSSSLELVERFLSSSGFDRAPWLTVGFGAGILAWFTMPNATGWCVAASLCFVAGGGALFWLWRGSHYPSIGWGLFSTLTLMGVGILVIWARSAAVGQEPIQRPNVGIYTVAVLAVEDRSAFDEVRFIGAMRDPAGGRSIKVRFKISDDDLTEHNLIAGNLAGSLVRFKGRLSPPQRPLFPGEYDFARTAWFSGLAATGSVVGSFELLADGKERGTLERWRAGLGAHIRSRVAGAGGGIATALATGDTGAISTDSAEAMRDAGLAHLLSISGLHVSAVVGALYVLSLRLLALWPALALRLRLPIAAALVGAVGGIGYTLLTGSQVPTIRSCTGSILVLVALALGRDALSLRMLAVAAFVIMLIWPESIVGPSFQMSFAAVLVIVVISNSKCIKDFFKKPDEGPVMRCCRGLAFMFVTGVAIELTLMPIGFYHFHRAGTYGALANLIAIPLTTFVIMPLEGGALLFDVFGAGEPLWKLVEYAIAMLLAVARYAADLPGSVVLQPPISASLYAVFLAGGLWIALWNGRIRYFGVLPLGVGAIGLFMLSSPDILIAGDGRNIGIVSASDQQLILLRDIDGYATEHLIEMAGTQSAPILMAKWPSAKCSPDFCVARLARGGRRWDILLARSHNFVPQEDLERACRASDIVISDRKLPKNCQPKWFKVDHPLLMRTGGMTVDLSRRTVRTVSQETGDHGWEQGV